MSRVPPLPIAATGDDQLARATFEELQKQTVLLQEIVNTLKAGS